MPSDWSAYFQLTIVFKFKAELFVVIQANIRPYPPPPKQNTMTDFTWFLLGRARPIVFGCLNHFYSKHNFERSMSSIAAQIIGHLVRVISHVRKNIVILVLQIHIPVNFSDRYFYDFISLRREIFYHCISFFSE